MDWILAILMGVCWVVGFFVLGQIIWFASGGQPRGQTRRSAPTKGI